MQFWERWQVPDDDQQTETETIAPEPESLKRQTKVFWK